MHNQLYFYIQCYPAADIPQIINQLIILRMEISLRQEEKTDESIVHALVEKAFKDMMESDHKEHLLVERLRNSESFIPELSLVAVSEEGTLVGHVLLTKISVQNERGSLPGLSLAPVR